MAPVTPPPASAAAPAAAAAAAGTIALPGPALAVSAGQALAARVLATGGGTIDLALAGGVVSAAGDLPLEPGQAVRLVVAEAGPDRVVLRVDPGPGAAPSPSASGPGAGAGGTAAALARAGVPAAASSALLAALGDAGLPPPSTPAAAAALAARVAAAGVATPAQAAAFARLEASGLPTTAAAVSGLAHLIDGPPLGRSLAMILDAAGARGGAGVPPPPVPGERLIWNGGGGSIGPTPPADAEISLPIGVPGRPGGGSPNWAVTAGPIGPSPAAAIPGVPAGPPATVSATPAPAAPGPGIPASLPALVAALGGMAEAIGLGAVSGDAAALRRAIADLGTGLEARMAAGDAPGTAPLRALLLALAAHPGAEAAVARAASGLADALAAQGLAGGGASAPGAPDPTAAGGAAYLQVPLPDGGTAEVRVAPDGRRSGGDGDGDGERDDGAPRRLAFLLHLSALGPVMIEATAGPEAVEAAVRVGGDEVRRFLGTRAADLADALRGAAPGTATVRVERLAGPAPERLAPPPPSSGLDLTA